MAEKGPIAKMFQYLWYGVDGIRKLLHLGLLLMLFALVLSAIPSDMPVLPVEAALVINPNGVLVDELAGDAYDRAVAELQGEPIRQALVRNIVSAIDAARDDPNVPGLILELDSLSGGGITKLETIAAAVQRFSAAGKPVYAYSSFYSQPSYYIAAAADEVWMHPHGGVFMTGFGNFQNYFRSAIDKLDIDWNVFRVGKYKSYAEPFTRDSMSEESRTASLAWLDDLWGSYISGVGAARDIEPATLQGLVDGLAEQLAANNGSWAEVSVQAGLVDRLLDRPAMLQELASLFGASSDDDGSYNGVGYLDYLANRQLGVVPAASDDTVAVVVASGPVVNGEAPPGQIGGDSLAALIRAARLDDDVRALVLRVDSGGGSVFASDVIQAELQAFKATGRPFVASMGSVAASAGYWISAAADRIYASPTTITGSIGVVGMFPTFERTLGRVGVSTDGVGTGALAGQFRPDRALSDDAQAVIQQLINADYDRFIGGVAEYRGMEKAAVNEVAQGRVWSGADALELGLIDAFGEIDTAIAAAADLAGLDVDSYATRYVEQPLSPIERLLLEFSGSSGLVGLLPTAPNRDGRNLARRATAWFTSYSDILGQYNDPKGVYSLCFCIAR